VWGGQGPYKDCRATDDDCKIEIRLTLPACSSLVEHCWSFLQRMFMGSTILIPLYGYYWNEIKIWRLISMGITNWAIHDHNLSYSDTITIVGRRYCLFLSWGLVLLGQWKWKWKWEVGGIVSLLEALVDLGRHCSGWTSTAQVTFLFSPVRLPPHRRSVAIVLLLIDIFREVLYKDVNIANYFSTLFNFITIELTIHLSL
jgi:hypothetical protein